MGSMTAMQDLARDMEALVAEDVAGLSNVDVRERLLTLLHLTQQLHGQLVRHVDVFDTRGLCVHDGCRSTRNWLSNYGRIAEFTAGDLVRGARLLRDLPKLAKVNAAGELPAEHLRQVTRLAQRVGVTVVAEVEPVLADAATQLDPIDFRQICGRVRAHADPDGEMPDAAVDFARRQITLSPFDGMILIRGQLDPEGGTALITALDAMTPPSADNDPRTPAQQRADALVELARGALTGGRLPTAGGVRPQVAVLVTPQQLMAGSRGTVTTGEPPWMDWAGDIPTPVAQRVACDADVWRVVLNPATGHPTATGRAHRLVPAWLRKALWARDRECRFPGCRAPHAWTDAHHLIPWARGGPTNINNLILLCRFHHSLIHEGRWIIQLHPTGEVTAQRPDGTPYEIKDHRGRSPTGHAA